MPDRLRKRRDELWRQLRDIEVALAELGGTDSSLLSWQQPLESPSEILTLTDEYLGILSINQKSISPEIIGSNVRHFIPPVYHSAIDEAAARVVSSGTPERVEYSAPGRGGTEAWYNTWLFPVASSKAKLALLSIDVTERHKLEEAVSLELNQFQALVANAPDTILIMDREHRIQMANRAPEGMTTQDLIGGLVEDWVPGARREQVTAAIERVFESGSPGAYVTEAPTQEHEGDRWFQVRLGPIVRSGKVNQVSLVAREITSTVERERALAEERESLRTSEARYRTLVDFAPEAVVILDAERGTFVDANRKACELFECTLEELLQRGPQELSPKVQADGRLSVEAIRDYVGSAINMGRPSFEWTHQTRGGREFPCEVRLVRLPDPKLCLVRGSITDISKRKAAEQERRRLTEELQHSQKLQAIGQLTGGIAHDFNNLLTVIVNSLEMIQVDSSEPQEVLLNAGQALEAAQRAGSLTQSLLAFARKQPLRPRVISLNKLVAGLEPLLRRTLGEVIAIETVLGGGLWPCEADPSQLESALLNLALNARDAMPAGGKLTIETANTKLDREYARTHEEVSPGQYTMLAVTDNGQGMSEDILKRAFDPFFTTKGLGKGSGLGLSSVYGFVKQSGGHVKIYSEVGEGTTIRIYLPRSGSDETCDPSPPPTELMPTGADRLVLVVEDDHQVRDTILRMLGRLQYATVAVCDAAEALERLEDHQDVALVLTDVVLPGDMNGARLAAKVRELRPDLPVVFMSGYTENAIIHNGRLDLGVALLEKPFSQHELAQCLAQALRQVDAPR